MPPAQSWKGKKRAGDASDTGGSRSLALPPEAYIHAYEAQLTYNQQDIGLEVASLADDLASSSRARGRGLIRWQDSEMSNIWAEKYDIVHLLTDLPSSCTLRPTSPASSSSSWGSLPSDEGVLFALSDPKDHEEYERRKKQLWINALREDRLREREHEDSSEQRDEDAESVERGWDPDEKPPKEVLTLMQHTAKSLAKSPNGDILEMRILAKQANNERFSFLRGRYREAWKSIKDAARKAQRVQAIAVDNQNGTVGNMLGSYGSDESKSDSEGESDVSNRAQPEPPTEEAPPPPPDVATSGAFQTDADKGNGNIHDDITATADENEIRRQRRLRVAEWKRRKAEQ